MLAARGRGVRAEATRRGSQKMNVNRRRAAAFKDKDQSRRSRVHAGKHPLPLCTRQGEGALLSAAADTA